MADTAPPEDASAAIIAGLIVERDAAQTELEQLAKEMPQLQAELTAARAEIATATADRDALREERKTVAEELTALKEHSGIIEEQRVAIETSAYNEAEQFRAEITDLKDQLARAGVDLAQLAAEAGQLQQDLEVAKRSYPTLEASQIADAHTCLDRFDVAREMHGRVLLLGDRIAELKIDKGWFQLVKRAHAALDVCGCAREDDAGGVVALDLRITALGKEHAKRAAKLPKK